MDADHLSDEHLVVLVQAGQQEALAQLYDRYGRAVYGLALRLLQDTAQAEEVTQDVFVNLWMKASSFRPEKGRVVSWLLAMGHHRAVDQLRKRNREQSMQGVLLKEALLGGESAGENPVEAAQRSEEAQQVRSALTTLPQEQQEVVVLAYYHGFTQVEISQRLRQPLGTVKTRMRLAMHKLRAMLAQRGAPNEV
ncbi:MAG: sigma-70 family RNA polymerase sigma factor [Chloroflexi bacterium]|nr:sigma-70 family RNA polymerase sigma factor [Chloroflexota bacterium]